MRQYKYLPIILALASLSACKKPITDGYTMPAPLAFVLLNKQGRNLITSVKAPLKIWSFTPQGKQFYVDYTGKEYQPIGKADSTSAFPYSYLFYDLILPVESSLGSKEWYLEINGKVDTLHYDVQHTRPDDRFHQYDVLSVHFNGQAVAEVNTPGVIPYYVFKRHH